MAGPNLDPTQLDRYSRHVIMDGVGPEGQAKLLEGRVLVVGAGGLGAPVIQYLAAAGVGTLGVVDHDVVERSNLQRQVVHGDGDVGRPKVASAADFVAALNPDVEVEGHQVELGPDLVVVASDNFRARFLVNDACTLAGVPFTHGAVYRFEGQATTFTADDDAPCYRCLFPEAPPPGTVPDCAEAGVLGVLPGTIGTVQATEALKLLLGAGDPLAGRLLVYEALGLTFDEVRFERDPECPVCGPAGIDSVDDVAYVDSCAV